MQTKSEIRLFSNFLLLFGGNSKTLPTPIQPGPATLEKQERQCVSHQRMRTHAEALAFSRLSAEFRVLAGSDRNARCLVEGLRDGVAITLTCAGGNGGTASFMPPTGRMGYGNVTIALALARQQLAGQGVAQPSPHQLQAALTGGKIISPVLGSAVKLPGILQLKKDGKGWGKIAGLLGVKLGDALGGAKIPVLMPPPAKLISLQQARKRKAAILPVTQQIS
ncbi:MAG: hypothetical protein ACREUV_00345 [Burkholderiales bacterium]